MNPIRGNLQARSVVPQPKKSATQVAVKGSVLAINPDDLTLGEMEEFEELSGRPLAKMLQGDLIKDDQGRPVLGKDGKPQREIDPRVKDMIALVFLAKRREDPEFTIEDARGIKVSELQIGAVDPQ